jgi:Domain of unknown function (DUF4190)
VQPPPGLPPPGPPGYGPPPGGFVPPPAGTYGFAPVPPKPTSTEAIVALVLGIMTMSTSCFPMGFVALYFGSKARKKAAEEGDTGTNATLALVGMIMGGIFGVIWLLFWLLEFGMIALGMGVAIFGSP